MRHDKTKIFELRKAGKTYREIQKESGGISRSTLSEWFKNEEWSKNIRKSNTERLIKISIENLKRLNDGRRIMLDKKYKEVEKEAKKEFNLFQKDPLFFAGLMLYVGEGDKRTKGIIRIANIDFFIHRIFIKFLITFMKVKIENLRLSILLYPDLNIDICKKKWSRELGIPMKNFYKPQVIIGRSKVKRLHFGVGSIIISNSFLKRKLLLWIELSKSFLIN